MIIIGSALLLAIGLLILSVQAIRIAFSLIKIAYYLIKGAVYLVVLVVCVVALAIQHILRWTRPAADTEPVVTINFTLDDDADIYDLPRTHFRRL
jgi:hypothetical protein